MCLSVNGCTENRHGHIVGHIMHILECVSLDKSLYMWL